MGLAEALLEEFGLKLGELVLRPSRGGIFEVSLDSEVIFSRSRLGRQPTIGEVKQALRIRVESS